MFNKNDYFLDDFRSQYIQNIINKAESLSDPKDYFQGLPSSEVLIPENILLFYRQKSIEKSAPALHHRFVLICNLGGEGSVVIDSKVFRVKEREGLLIYPHQFHIYADIASEKISWVFITFELEHQGVLSNKENLSFKLSDYSLSSLSLLLDTYISFSKESLPAKINERLLLAAILSEMTSNLNAHNINQEALKEDVLSNSLGLVQKVVKYVYQNISEPIQINDVAKSVHLSPSYLRSLFQQTMRIGLGSYIRTAKIHRACFLIRSTDFSFSQITKKCGFSSLYSFSRAFRHEVKMSPTEYKNQYSK